LCILGEHIYLRLTANWRVNLQLSLAKSTLKCSCNAFFVNQSPEVNPTT